MKNKIFGVVLIMVTLLLIVGCSPSEKVIEIGNIGIISGQGASWGVAAKNGIDLAVAEINADGGINGKMLVANHQDDKGDSKEAINAFNNLVDVKGIKIIIGTTWSSTGMPLANLADSKKVLLISPSLGKPEFNEGSDYIFNTWPHDYILSKNLADYVYEKGHRNVALIGAEELWVKDQTNAFKQRFEELGGEVSVLVEPLPDQKDVGTEALKIKNGKTVDALVSTTDGILVGALVAKRAKEIGVDLPIYSITIDADAIAAAGGAYEGMEFLTFLNPTTEFKQKYEAKYGTLDIGAPSAYDAVMMIADAIKKTGSEDPTKLQEYLNTVKEYDGASGKLVADGKGGFTKEGATRKIVNGKITNLQ